ncbi:MAG: riboflavin synthase, partial [Minicystis sp.]
HTIGRTLLEDAGPGAHVNIEVDVLARYVARQLEVQGRDRMVPGHSAHGADDEGQGEMKGSDGDHDRRILAKLKSGGYV